MRKKKSKMCLFCFNEVKENERYNVVKHNTLFKDGPNPKNIWTCLMKHYICEECTEKLRTYIKENDIDIK